MDDGGATGTENPDDEEMLDDDEIKAPPAPPPTTNLAANDRYNPPEAVAQYLRGASAQAGTPPLRAVAPPPGITTPDPAKAVTPTPEPPALQAFLRQSAPTPVAPPEQIQSAPAQVDLSRPQPNESADDYLKRAVAMNAGDWSAGWNVGVRTLKSLGAGAAAAVGQAVLQQSWQRALGRADVGDVVIADGMTAGLDRWATAEPMGPQQLKNRTAPMPMWRVAAVTSLPRRRPRATETTTRRCDITSSRAAPRSSSSRSLRASSDSRSGVSIGSRLTVWI
jgi:hypothetical protein